MYCYANIYVNLVGICISRSTLHTDHFFHNSTNPVPN